MKVRATRGVCVGVERNLDAGEVADLEPSLVQFLKSIRAVEDYVEPAPVETVETVPTKKVGTKEK